MHARRAIMLFALVLGLTALAAALSPPRDSGSPSSRSAPTSPVSPARTLSLDSAAPATRIVRVGERVILTVSSPSGGLVTIPALGRTASVTAATPARFSLLAPVAGRYEVRVLPSGAGPGEGRRAGTLVTKP